jgi:hypothetical protein
MATHQRIKSGPKPKPVAERFWSKVDKKGPLDCWEWTAGLRRHGYGQFNVDTGRRSRPAHRIAWELHYGPIHEGLHVLHRCDNPPCCNPAHLFLGTHIDNVADMMAKKRNWTPRGDKSGMAKLSQDDIAYLFERTRAGDAQARLAEHFGVSSSTISRILSGKRWAHATAAATHT